MMALSVNDSLLLGPLPMMWQWAAQTVTLKIT